MPDGSFRAAAGRLCLAMVVCLGVSLPAFGQADVQSQMREFRAALEEMSARLAASQSESEALRREVQSLREEVQRLRGDLAPAPDLAEEARLLNAKLDEQHQAKVDSGSKYRLRLSGMALLSGFYTRGAVDDIDIPHSARPPAPGESRGSFAATARQSQVALEVTGPALAGANTSGEVRFDFFGGFPANPEGVTSGLVRLRTAAVRLDWKRTSVIAGQESPFLSPRSPTSLASTAYPALSGAGNLWTWTPQVYVDRSLYHSDRWKVSLQGGVLDALTGELPVTEYDRTPASGEYGRMPAYATRIAAERSANDRTSSWAAGAYYARQNWGFDRRVDAWAATTDWDVSPAHWMAISGELYWGRAIGGLGGGATGSAVLAGNSVLPVRSAGGWAQVKFRPAERVQFNAAFGKDGSSVAQSPALSGLVHRNAAGFVNVIYQPRSIFLLSVEYRRLWTSRYWRPLSIADQIGWGAGILF